ncbi:hypothetical protein HK097_009902 [Rhizophlyctis rosea]|uniref:Uncharacterized protein n=1 Tax=Rhizophlyctis rosea TaxID=64517 RepID=A0AAD5X0S9_9FUNG|nr:hypothetical protein HK097_009902 [Rhizophlyctis rosea]
MTGTQALLLVSSELFTRDLCFANLESVNCLAMIELDTPVGSYMYWKNPGGYLDSGVPMSYCRFRFLDSNSLNEVDFRGAGFTIQLAILTDDDDSEIKDEDSEDYEYNMFHFFDLIEYMIRDTDKQESMENTEIEENQEIQQESVESPDESPKTKSKRGVMTEQKRKNLEKARQIRKENLAQKKITKYPKEAREAAEEKLKREMEEKIQAQAEKRAEEILKKKELEKEIAELRAWKKAQAERVYEEVETPKKKKPAPKKVVPKKAPAPKKRPKKQVESDDESEDDLLPAPRRSTSTLRGGRAPVHEQEVDWISNFLD